MFITDIKVVLCIKLITSKNEYGLYTQNLNGSGTKTFILKKSFYRIKIFGNVCYWITFLQYSNSSTAFPYVV